VPPALRGVPLLDDLGDLDGRHVLVRVDFNVPLERTAAGEWAVADDFRIRSTVPTLRALLDRGATVVCCSHLGRPSGPGDPHWQMAPVRDALAAICPEAELMENLRFEPGESANDPAFVDRLVDGFDAYVNDAFGASHRAHASIVGPPERLPSAAGLRLAREVEVIAGLLDEPKRPFVAVLGGAKVADKLGVVASVGRIADAVLIGGAMAFTFLASQGRGVGASLVDQSRIDDCWALLGGASRVVLPTDIVALSPGAAFGPGCIEGDVKCFEGDLPDGWVGLDIGETSAAVFSRLVSDAATVLWNGPMGAFEDDRFASGTDAVAHAVAKSSSFSVVGGGDSALALERSGLSSEVSFVSTGGGATLKLLEHGDLPALVALRGASNAPSRL